MGGLPKRLVQDSKAGGLEETLLMFEIVGEIQMLSGVSLFSTSLDATASENLRSATSDFVVFALEIRERRDHEVHTFVTGIARDVPPVRGHPGNVFGIGHTLIRTSRRSKFFRRYSFLSSRIGSHTDAFNLRLSTFLRRSFGPLWGTAGSREGTWILGARGTRA